jgi:hypothetical protein
MFKLKLKLLINMTPVLTFTNKLANGYGNAAGNVFFGGL